MNNVFSNLSVDKDIGHPDIENEEEHTRQKNRLRNLSKKKNPTPEQRNEMKILKANIARFKQPEEGIPTKKKKKVKKKQDDSDKELDEAFAKNSEMNKFKEQIKKEMEMKYRRESLKLKRENEDLKFKNERLNDENQGLKCENRRLNQENERLRNSQKNNQKKDQNSGKAYKKPKSKREFKFCEKYNVEIPEDILEILNEFDRDKWRKLSVKYHPDKGNDTVYQQILNEIKELFGK